MSIILESNIPTKRLTTNLLFILTFAAGLSVANIYYNQPMIGILAKEFNVSTFAVSFISTLTQAGYALGIFFLSSLGDRIERKTLIIFTMFLLGLTLLLVATSSNLIWLGLSSLIVGILATVTQQIVPLAVNLAEPDKRGKVIGTITGGILLGILLSRAISGIITDYYGWRMMFYIASGVTFLLMLFLWFYLPIIQPNVQIGYKKLLISIFSLFNKFKTLRQAAFIQGLLFSAFLAFWTNISSLFELPSFGLGSTAVGMLSLVGAVGVFSAPIAGRMADKKDPKSVVTISISIVIFSFLLFYIFQNAIIGIISGVILLDIAVQFSQVSNQTRIYALDATARSRLNTAFMTTMFLGGSFGSLAGSIGYQFMGWNGVCIYGVIASCGALIISLKK
ncbi:MFS transporter [Vibrio sp. S11_S32]|uniref:MFS transporter n=1 Tax=Vibrio sp. S11_S32 TaxID=2720225 RepID=UPI0016803E41|nr:MFS transporter [Vibrio sp. S11_S32]MBD1577966.1 MFS transporter [Vibrio sp. S11_S32]